jgi:hypothetical protein
MLWPLIRHYDESYYLDLVSQQVEEDNAAERVTHERDWT